MKIKALDSALIRESYKRNIRSLIMVMLFLILLTIPQILNYKTNSSINTIQDKENRDENNAIFDPKNSQLGTFEWDKAYNESKFGISEISKNGSIIFIGVALNISGIDQYNISAFTENGELMWSYQSNGTYSYSIQKLVLNENESMLYVFGDYFNSTEGFEEINLYLSAIYTSNGTLAFEKYFHENNGINDLAVSMLLSPLNSSLYLISSYQEVIITEISYETIENIMLTKLDLQDYSITWSKLYSDLYSILPKSAILTSDERYIYIAGDRSVNRTTTGIFLYKFNANGELTSIGHHSPNKNISISSVILNEEETMIYGIGTSIFTFSNATLFTFDINCNNINESSFGQSDRDDIGRHIVANPSNNTFYISGLRILYGPESQMGISSFFGEIDLDLNILWINYTEEPELGYYQVYYHFSIDPFNNYMINAQYLVSPSFPDNITIYKQILIDRPIAPQLYINISKPVRDPSILLFWNNITNADNYSLYGSEDPFSSISQGTLISENIQELNFSLLLNETSLRYFRITAKNIYGESRPSNMVEIIYLDQTSPYFKNPFVNMNKANYTLNGNIYQTINTSLRFEWDPTDADYYLVIRNNSMIANITDTYYLEMAIYGDIWNYSIIGQKEGVNSSNSNSYLIKYLNATEPVSLQIESMNPIIQNITLNWTQSSNADYYHIFASMSPYHEIEPLKYMLPIETTTNLEINLTLTYESNYYFIVVAVSENGSSIISNIVNGFVYMPIITPEIYSAINRTTSRSAIIQWTNVAAEYYLVFRSKTPFDSIDGMEPYLNITDTLFQDNYTEIGVYYYRMIAHKNGINSSLSNIINISVEDVPEAPQIGFEYPTEFVSGFYEPYLSPIPYMNYTAPNLRKTTINWSSVENADNYLLYKHTTPISMLNIDEAQLIANTTYLNYADFAISNSQTYFYAVRAINSSGYGSLSSVINITHIFAPDTLTINGQKTKNRTITISWDAVSFPPSGVILLSNQMEINETIKINSLINNEFEIYFPQNARNITFEARIGTWYYALVGINEFGFSNLSNVVMIHQDPVPYQPLLLELPEKQYNKTVILNWSAQSLAEYYIYRSTTPIEESEHLVPLATSSNNYYTDTVESSGIYYYAIIAYNGTGNSSLSNVEQIEILNRPITPILNDVANAVNTLNISWTDPYDYYNYSVKISLYPDFESAEASIWIHNITEKEFQFSANFTATLYIWVISHNASGPSLNGTYKSATLYYIPSPRLWYLGLGIFVDTEIEFYIDPIEHVESFEVYRSKTAFTNISGMTPWKIINYTTTFKENISELGTYYYIFVPINQYGKGPLSNRIEIDRNDRPKTPKILNATVDEYNSVTVIWESLDPEWILGYRVFYSRTPITNDTDPATLITSGNLDRDRISFKFVHIGYGKFYFAVCSFNASSLSYYSAVIELDIQNVLPERTPMPYWILYLVGGITMAGVITYALVMRSRRKTERLLESL